MLVIELRWISRLSPNQKLDLFMLYSYHARLPLDLWEGAVVKIT